MTNYNYNRGVHNYNHIPNSEMIARKGRKVGVEDLETAALIMKFARESGKLFSNDLR